MNDEKCFVAGQIPFIVNIGHKDDPNVKTVKENGELKLKEVMSCTGIKVDVEGSSGELTPEEQEEILNEEY